MHAGHVLLQAMLILYVCGGSVRLCLRACMCVDVCGLCGIGPSHGLVVVLSSLTHAYACE